MPQNSHLSASAADIRRLLARIDAAHQAANQANNPTQFDRAINRLAALDNDRDPVVSAAWARRLIEPTPVFGFHGPVSATALTSEGIKFLLNADRGHGLALVAA